MQTYFPCRTAMVNHGAPLEGDDDPDCPNRRGQGTSLPCGITYMDANQVTHPGAANLWTGDNTWSDLVLDLDSDLPDLIPPDGPDTGLINHGQSNPEQLVEPDPRQAPQEEHAEQTTNRGRRKILAHNQMETPTNSRAEIAWNSRFPKLKKRSARTTQLILIPSSSEISVSKCPPPTRLAT